MSDPRAEAIRQALTDEVLTSARNKTVSVFHVGVGDKLHGLDAMRDVLVAALAAVPPIPQPWPRHELDFVLSAQAMDLGAIDLPAYEASRMAKILRPYNPSADLHIRMWVPAPPAPEDR